MSTYPKTIATALIPLGMSGVGIYLQRHEPNGPVAWYRDGEHLNLVGWGPGVWFPDRRRAITRLLEAFPKAKITLK